MDTLCSRLSEAPKAKQKGGVTALRRPGVAVVDVTSLKYFMSPGRRHGMVPLIPIPPLAAAATTTLKVRWKAENRKRGQFELGGKPSREHVHGQHKMFELHNNEEACC